MPTRSFPRGHGAAPCLWRELTSRFAPLPTLRSVLRARPHLDHAARAYSIAQAHHAFDLGAMLAAEERAFLFESVTDDMDAAVLAGRRQRMDRALEAVEGVGRAVHAHLKRLVVVVSAGFASGHDCLPFGWRMVLEPITRAIPRRFRPVRGLCGEMTRDSGDDGDSG